MILEFECKLCGRSIIVDTQLHERVYGRWTKREPLYTPIFANLSAHLFNKHRLFIPYGECLPPQTFELKKMVGETSRDSKLKETMKKVFKL